MLLLTSFPPDIRLEKEINSLSKNHEIYVLSTRRGTQSSFERYDKYNVVRIFNNLERWISNIEILYRIKSYLWVKEIKKFIDKYQIDVLHVHDLPLLYSAVIVKKKINIPIVSDLHENYPEMLIENKKLPISEIKTLPQLLKRFISSRKWKKYEKKILHKVDYIIVVVEEAKQRLLEEHGVEKEKITIISNYENPPKNNVEKKSNKYFTFFYAGGFDYVRDLETLIIATSMLPHDVKKNIRVLMIGGKGKYLQKLVNLRDSLDLSDVVYLREFIPFKQMYKLMINCNVGLVPHVKSNHTDSTIPHKLFQYMALALPVIVSNCKPLERIISDSDCGLIYESKNPNSLKTQMFKMYNMQNDLKIMSNNSLCAFNQNYNWSICEKKIINMYKNIEDVWH